jgi:hypothetical protein
VTNKQNEITEQATQQVGQVHREGKKTAGGTPPLATSMLALRLNRANRQWDAYWAKNLK